MAKRGEQLNRRWRTCLTCMGTKAVRNDKGKQVPCPACNGQGGIWLGNV